MVDDVVPVLGERRHQKLLQVEPSVIAADVYAMGALSQIAAMADILTPILFRRRRVGRPSQSKIGPTSDSA